MAFRSPTPLPPSFSGLAGPPARDLVALLAILFATFAFQFFAATAWLPALLRLSPAVWQQGFLWQLVTYPFAGYGPPSLWFLLELLILYIFGNQVYWRLGRRRFWQVLVVVAAAAAAAATLVALSGRYSNPTFPLMQGQRMLLVILIAAFATAFGDATVLLFFVLPLKARWFLWLEVAVAFVGFLASRDFPGFVGVCAGVGGTYLAVAGRGGRRQVRLRLEMAWLTLTSRLRRRPKLRLVDREPPNRWLH